MKETTSHIEGFTGTNSKGYIAVEKLVLNFRIKYLYEVSGSNIDFFKLHIYLALVIISHKWIRL